VRYGELSRDVVTSPTANSTVIAIFPMPPTACRRGAPSDTWPRGARSRVRGRGWIPRRRDRRCPRRGTCSRGGTGPDELERPARPRPAVGARTRPESRACRDERWWLAVTTEVVPWAHPGERRRGPERRFEVDSSGINRWAQRNWKMWLGVGLALAVVAVLVVLIAANSGGGSGGLY